MTLPLTPFVRHQDSLHRIGLLVEGAHCGGCLARIERLMRADPVVREARFNLSLKRLSLAWEGEAAEADRLAAKLAAAGFGVAPYAIEALAAEDAATGQELLRCLGVAAFAAANTMMLSIAVWSGQAQDMGPGTQIMLQWITGILGVAAVAYAGRPFYRSALGALRARRTNIDVPISLGLILTTAISVQEAFRGGRDVYFDSATALAFVLLIGRVLEHRVRGGPRPRHPVRRRAGSGGAGGGGAWHRPGRGWPAPGREAGAAGGETMLHRLAKQLIQQRGEVKVPPVISVLGDVADVIHEGGVFRPTDVALEVTVPGMRPDIVARQGSKTLYVEVAVWHKVGRPKQVLIEERRQSTIEIDLKDLRYETDQAALERAILYDAPREWLFNATKHDREESARKAAESAAAARRARQEAVAARVVKGLDLPAVTVPPRESSWARCVVLG